MVNTTPVVSGSGPVRQAGSDAAKANLDYDAFLRLFIASMKNQNPTKPNDPSQTLAQLASFSNVEQSIKLNDKLDQLVSSSAAAVAASMVGKELSSLDGGKAGLVSAIEIGKSGPVAILEDGTRLDLSLGYRITEP